MVIGGGPPIIPPMDSTRFRRCREIFEQAIELEAGARDEFVRAQCADDEALRLAVHDMLAADTDAGAAGFLAASGPRIPAASLLDLVGLRVGDYELVRKIATGGMGSVYEAEQENPRRRVAVKMLSTLFPSAAMLRRFQVESEILGRLTHPAIARVIQAGVHTIATDEVKVEVPWYAMELLDGARPITQFAAELMLDRPARVDLGIEVADAIHHAHTHGAIHRDIKPGNVLVDRAGQPKVIDFGVARQHGPFDAARATLTAQGELLGTPAYMAPEQLTGDPDRVDTRADVYALGVLLYELLCGALPFEVRGKSLTEVLDIVRQREPRRPRATAPDLPLELEWILLHALAREPDERYASAAELRDDLRRFRHNEAVLASPPSTAYRVRKFVRRNRTAVLASSAVLLALIGGLIASLISLDRARTAEQRAVLSLEQARTAEKRAVREASVSQQVIDILKTALQQARVENRGKDLRVADVLDDVATRADTSLADEPWVAAMFHSNLGELYYSLGTLDAAEREMTKSLETLRASEYAESAEVVSAYANLVQIVLALGRPTDALPLLAQAVALGERILPADDRTRLYLRQRRGAVLFKLGNYAEAEVEYRRAHADRLRVFGPTSLDTLESLNSLSVVVAEQHRLEEAEALTKQVIAGLTAKNGADHAFTIQARENLALLVRDRGDAAQALELLTPLLEAKAKAHGADHPSTLQGRLHRAEILLTLARYDDVVAETDALREPAQRRLGVNHPTTLLIDATQCRALLNARRFDDAEALARRALAAAGEGDRPGTRMAVGHLRASLGRALAAGASLDPTRVAAAEQELAAGLESMRKAMGAEHAKSKEIEKWLEQVRAPATSDKR